MLNTLLDISLLSTIIRKVGVHMKKVLFIQLFNSTSSGASDMKLYDIEEDIKGLL